MHADEKPSLGLDVWKWQILFKNYFWHRATQD